MCEYTCGRGADDRCVCIHVFNEVLGHPLQLLHLPHIQRNASAWDRNWARGRGLHVHTHKAISTYTVYTLFT